MTGKSRTVIIVEGFLFAIIAIASPFSELYLSDRPVTQRAIIAVSLLALIGGANALKAFLSQSYASWKTGGVDKPLEVVTPPDKPLEIAAPPGEPVQMEEVHKPEQ